MSGGSWDYIYCQVDEVADRLLKSGKANRRALGRKLAKIAAALKAIEWVDSCDSSKGSEDAEIKAALEPEYRDMILQEVIMDAEKSLGELRKAIEEAKTTAKQEKA